MRASLIFACLLTLSIVSCKKDSNPGNINPPPPPPVGGGGTGAVTITSISPVTPFEGDIVTIKGTGFDPDKNKDTVLIGVYDLYQKVFIPGGMTIPLYKHPRVTILTASATELTFKADTSSNFTDFDANRFAIQVSTPSGSRYTGDTLYIKDLPRIIAVTSTDPYMKPVCDVYKVFAGDSIYIDGVGLYPPLTVTIDDKPLDFLRSAPTSDHNSRTIETGFIGIDYFGTATPPVDGNCTVNTNSNKIIKIVTGDGKTAIYSTPFTAGPNSQILSCSMPNNFYSRTKDGSGLLTMSGYAVRNFSLRVTGFDASNQQPFSEDLGSNAGDLTGIFSQAIDFGPLPASGGEFQVTVKDGNGNNIGGFHFTLIP